MTGFPTPEEHPLLTVRQALDALDNVPKRSAFYCALKSDAELGGCVVRVNSRVFLSTARLRRWAGLDLNSNGATNGTRSDEEDSQ
jgi:hypothetical protein